MPNATVPTAASAAPLGLASRFFGVIASPKSTFQAVVAHPRWLGMLIVVAVLVAFFAALPMTTEAGREATLRAQVDGMEALGLTVSDQMYESMRRGLPFAPYQTGISTLVFVPIFTVAFAGILFAVFNGVMGGNASFRQLFAVLVHASVISALQQLFAGPVNYFRGDVRSATNLAALLPTVEDTSFAGWVLALTDLFLIWYLLVLAMGLAVLYRRRTQPIALTLYGVYAAVVLVIAALMGR